LKGIREIEAWIFSTHILHIRKNEGIGKFNVWQMFRARAKLCDQSKASPAIVVFSYFVRSILVFKFCFEHT